MNYTLKFIRKPLSIVLLSFFALNAPIMAAEKSSASAQSAVNQDLATWGKQIREKLAVSQPAWDWTAPSRQIRVKLAIGTDGTLKSARLLNSSGKQSVDKDIERAIRGAAPFPPAPSSLKEDTYTFTTLYNLGNAGTVYRSGQRVGPLSTWHRSITAKILRNPPTFQGKSVGKSATVEFSIRNDGSLQNASMKKSTGSEALDAEIIGKVRAAAPFDKPPSSMGPGPFKLRFDINY